MVGASAQTNGVAGLVPMPRAGDQAKFLRGDGSWATINIPTFDTDIFTSTLNEISLNGYGLAPVGSTPIKTNNGIEWATVAPGHLKRTITTLAKLQAQLSGEDPDPIDEDTIYMVLNGTNGSNKYDEYMIINNRLEQLGTFGSVDLTDYVQVTTFNTEVKKLEDVLYDQENENTGDVTLGLVSRVAYLEQNYVSQADIGDLNQLILSAGNSNLVEEVNTLHTNVSLLDERLKWQELNNDNE